MSWNHNKPSNKSSQTFECVHPWEGKHIFGKNGSKLAEFRAYDGIADITKSDAHKYTRFSGPPYAKFYISGKPHAVNKVIEDMGKWLKECQNMHYANGNGIF